MSLKSEKNIFSWPDSNFWRSMPREEEVGELQTTRLSIQMMRRACFLGHNPRRSAIFRWNSTHSRQQILWVRESWSLPLNLKLLSDVYFHIKSKKLAPLTLFLTHRTIENFWSMFYSINKMENEVFLIFGSWIKTIFGLFIHHLESLS